MILDDLNSASAIHFGDATVELRNFRKGETSPGKVFLYPIPLVDDLSENHWEDHALLGQEVVRAIHDIRVRLKWYADFCDEVSAKELQSSDVALWHGRSKGDMIINPDGSVNIPMHNVVETNEILTGEIRRSVERLRAALKDRPTG